jgi:F-type H+-transporting ATPase subunit delta
MQELVAKRYVKALGEATGSESLANIAELFNAITAYFANKSFLQIMENPDVAQSEKESILLSAVKPAKSEKLNNFMRLLVENGRISIIPAMAEEMRKEIARSSKNYSGIVYSNEEIDAKTLEDLSTGLGKKVDATVVLEFVKSDYDGLKVEVTDLDMEINFSKSRVNAQLIEHILKAI